ncbi:MAG: hypothetical protein NC238_03420 [Dehalobacter sp.]|nr:hypothetical protein [Dehalobacter sp.]
MKKLCSKILFLLFVGCFILLLKSPAVYAATITAPSSITANTTWTSDNVYVVSSTTVQPNVTLTIEPGTVVKLNAINSKLVIKGTLNALGSDTNQIAFRRSKMIHMAETPITMEQQRPRPKAIGIASSLIPVE